MKNNIEGWNPDGKMSCFIAIPKTGSNLIQNVIQKSFLVRNLPKPISTPGHVSLNKFWYHHKKLKGWQKNNDLYNFSIIRNPYDLFCSLIIDNWPYHINKSRSGFSKYSPTDAKREKEKTYKLLNQDIFSKIIIEKLNNTENMFCKRKTTIEKTYNSFFHIPFIQIFDDFGNIGVDAILRFENAKENINILSNGDKEIVDEVNKKINPLSIEEKYNPNYRARDVAKAHVLIGKTEKKTRKYQHYYNEQAISLMEEKLGWFMKIFGYSFRGPTGENKLVTTTKDISKNDIEMLRNKVNRTFKY